jgi:hypothetical protein
MYISWARIPLSPLIGLLITTIKTRIDFRPRYNGSIIIIPLIVGGAIGTIFIVQIAAEHQIMVPQLLQVRASSSQNGLNKCETKD